MHMTILSGKNSAYSKTGIISTMRGSRIADPMIEHSIPGTVLRIQHSVHTDMN